MKTLLPLLFLICFCSVQAQDIHFTQWGLSAWALNPASQVAMPELTRVTLQHRQQWQQIPVPFVTSALTVEHRGRISAKDGWGVGVTLMQDESGDGQLRWAQVAPTFGYRRLLGKALEASIAFQPSFKQRSFSPRDLSFGEQYNGEYYDPSLPTGENWFSQRRNLFSLGLGGLVRWSPEKGPIRLAEAGVSQYNANRPKYSFYEEATSRLQARTNVHASAIVGVGKRSEWVGLYMLSVQGPHLENVATLAYRYNVSVTSRWPLQAEMGGGLRFGDAYFGALTLRYGPITAGYSFDVNYSDLKAATNQRGGPEIGLRYAIMPVKLPKVTKVCPVF